MNFKYVLPIIKSKLRIDLHRQRRGEKLCHGGQENRPSCPQTAGGPAESQSSPSWSLQSKPAFLLSLHLCAPRAGRLCVHPKWSHWASEHAGSPPRTAGKGHLPKSTGGWEGVTGSYQGSTGLPANGGGLWPSISKIYLDNFSSVGDIK